MKKVHNELINLIVLIFLPITINFTQSITDGIQLEGKLIVKIVGFSNNEGECWFALDNVKEVYERRDTVWIGKIVPIENKQVVVIIDSLKYGEYAVRVFQDENRNGKLDTNFLGIPTEDYGYSNNASGLFGPPSWEKAKFLFSQPEMTMEIEVSSFL